MSNILSFLAVALVLIFIYVLARVLRTPPEHDSFESLTDTETSQTEKELPDEEDFSNDFFTRVNAGEKKQYFAEIASNQDCSIIRSMLYSAGIPSYIEGAGANSLYGSVAGVRNAVFSIRLMILTQDYDEAHQIIKDYIEQKKQVLKAAGIKYNNSRILDTIVDIAMAPYPMSQADAILGINILPKEE